MKRLIWTTGFLALAALAACASKDDDAEKPQPNDGAGTGIEPYQPEGNGVRTSEAEACQRMVAALDERASELGCVITYPPCPNYLRQSTEGTCYEYDEGTIDSCVAFIGKYQTCNDFQFRPCIVKYFEDSTCAEDDAGTDAADDSDAAGDAADDADTSDAEGQDEGAN